MEDKVGLGTPWACYVARLEALFAQDPDVRVDYDGGTEVTVRVDGTDKAEALTALLPGRKEYGNVVLDIHVVPANREMAEEDMYIRAFAGNPAFVDVETGYGPAHDVSYALFDPRAVQVQEDDISEFKGFTTLTYAQLAESVLDRGAVLVSSALLY